eukprot:TRINITY_DN3275_c0_g1_i1.p1 TRINITY_DN3275_c0_g1~~TRINITY_DN3275_c0_g1_i1.p1  ORF type:complete len:300 (-),score=58.71 TRINITY_DN3275_c0_g1_i1:1030-1929(-)
MLKTSRDKCSEFMEKVWGSKSAIQRWLLLAFALVIVFGIATVWNQIKGITTCWVANTEDVTKESEFYLPAYFYTQNGPFAINTDIRGFCMSLFGVHLFKCDFDQANQGSEKQEVSCTQEKSYSFSDFKTKIGNVDITIFTDLTLDNYSKLKDHINTLEGMMPMIVGGTVLSAMFLLLFVIPIFLLFLRAYFPPSVFDTKESTRQSHWLTHAFKILFFFVFIGAVIVMMGAVKAFDLKPKDDKILGGGDYSKHLGVPNKTAGIMGAVTGLITSIILFIFGFFLFCDCPCCGASRRRKLLG